MVVSETLFGIAAGARKREILELVGASVILGNDVLQGGAIARRSIGQQRQLRLTVNALALEDWLAVELLRDERRVRSGDHEKHSLLATCSHAAIAYGKIPRSA
mgnify:CR=1 FL=1